MELIDGKIVEYYPNGDMTIKARLDNVERFIKCGYKSARILLQDNRTISNEQRKKIYSMLNEIADFMGEYPDIVKSQMKLEFKMKRLESLADEISFSYCSVELASEFIDFLIEFIIAWGIPLKQPLIDYCEDVKRYVYTSLKYKKCAVCGKEGELHHVDTVGMGNDRREIAHEGKQALSLCRKHHSEAHSVGNGTFLRTYHLEAVRLDKRLCGAYKLKTSKENKEDE